MCERVPLDGADQRERDARAAAGVLDDGAARLQAPVGLGGLDHGERHPVLHAAGRILALELQQDARAAAGTMWRSGSSDVLPMRSRMVITS